MKNTEERKKHLKELEQVEKALKVDLKKVKMERHKLESWQDQSSLMVTESKLT